MQMQMRLMHATSLFHQISAAVLWPCVLLTKTKTLQTKYQIYYNNLLILWCHIHIYYSGEYNTLENIKKIRKTIAFWKFVSSPIHKLLHSYHTYSFMRQVFLGTFFSIITEIFISVCMAKKLNTIKFSVDVVTYVCDD